jgi:hypothetical protein
MTPVSRRARAAARVAAVYAAGTALLLLVLVLPFGDGMSTLLEDLAILSVPVGLCFVMAFVLLAAARRAGFTALWAVLLALHLWLSLRERPYGPRPDLDFVLWSVLAAPLYLIGVVGFPATGAKRRRWPERAGAIAWAALAVLGFVSGTATYSGALVPGLLAASGALELAWRIAPVAISIAAIRRVHRGAAPDAATA